MAGCHSYFRFSSGSEFVSVRTMQGTSHAHLSPAATIARLYFSFSAALIFSCLLFSSVLNLACLSSGVSLLLYPLVATS